ncbi:MAG TPA: DUF6049 family protein [Mycobacteriales bacterium]|nr:DUF6049 family protein [Mycobacteriales bacterium]
MRRLLPVAGLLAALVGAPATAAPSPSPAPEPEDPIRVVVTQILPRAPQRDGAVEVTGQLRNAGSVRVTDLRVRLQVGDQIGSHSELQAAEVDRPPTTNRAFAEPVLKALDPGQTTGFSVRTTVRALGLARLGVYPLDVVARGNAGDGIDSLGLAPTWLPYFDGFTPRPTRVAVAWPLVDVPQLRPDGSLVDGGALARSLSGTGRLGRLLAQARAAQVPSCERAPVTRDGTSGPPTTRCDPVAVTFAVDPELLEAAQVLGGGAGDGAATARAWLADLRGAGLDGRVVALPYADPDVGALSRVPRGKDDIATASALGRQVVTDVLGVRPETGVAWPPAGPVAAEAADALALSGARAFLLDASAYDDDGRRPDVTPGTHAVFTTSATGAELAGLVIDPELSAQLVSSSPYGARVTEQRFLAETAVIAAEKPSVSRTLVIAPPRRATVSTAAGEELRDLGRVPWLCPVSLAAVMAATETCARESGPPAAPAERGELRSDASEELSQSYLRTVEVDRDRGTQLTDAVLSPAPALRSEVAALKGRLRRAVARAQSSAGRDQPLITRRSGNELHAEVRRLTAQVVVRGGRSLLTSSKGTLSVSLENTLSLPVQVRVRFTSKTATLTNAETGLVTVQPGHAVQASVRAQAQRSGQFVVFARILDRDGVPFGPESEIIVRSTRFGRLALAVTLAALTVLLAAAGYRIVRRVRAARS